MSPRLLVSRLLPLFLGLSSLLGAGPAAAEGDRATRIVRLLADLRDQLEAPGLTAEAAARTLGTPERALAFVRDDVAFLPYRGAWHGAEGTLRLRVANALDKAWLLRDLLGEMGIEARLVAAPWPADARPHRGREDGERPRALEELRRVLGLPAEPAPVAIPAELRRERPIRERLDTLRRTLTSAGMADRLEGTPERVEEVLDPRQWAWVQIPRASGGWLDLDPTLPERARPETGVTVITPHAVKATISLTRGERSLVAWGADASALLTGDAQILFVPDGADMGAAREPASVARWRPILQVGATRFQGEAFDPAVAGVPGLTLMVSFEDAGESPARHFASKRVIMRFPQGFDAQQLVSLYRIGSGVGYVPLHVATARQLDELLELRSFERAGTLPPNGGSAPRGVSARTARVLNALFGLMPQFLQPSPKLGWTGPAVFVESVSLSGSPASGGASHAPSDASPSLHSVARIDIWRRAFMPVVGSTRAARAAFGLATAALEGYLVRGRSVNEQLGRTPEALEVLAGEWARAEVARDEIAVQVLSEGGVVIRDPNAARFTWSLPESGDLLATVSLRGVSAKGGESTSEVAGRGYAALGGAALGALGAPSGMLVGGIAGYLGELAKAYEGAANKIDIIGNAIASGDDSELRQAIEGYRGDLGRRLAQALGEGAGRGWAESVLGAGLGHVLPGSGNPYGPTVGDRLRDGAIAGGLAYPQDLPLVTETVRAASAALRH